MQRGCNPFNLLGQILGPDAGDHELRARARTAFLDPDDRARTLRAAYEKVLSGDMDPSVSDRIQNSWGPGGRLRDAGRDR